MGLGSNEPHCPAGRQEKLTPPLALSLVTTAAIPAVAPAFSAEGGGKEVLNAIMIAGAWYLDPQATSTAIVPAATMTLAINGRINWRKVIRWFDAMVRCNPQGWSLASLLRLKSAERKLVCQKLALITIQWSQTYIARSVFTMPTPEPIDNLIKVCKSLL
jgi:hypothetical protein